MDTFMANSGLCTFKLFFYVLKRNLASSLLCSESLSCMAITEEMKLMETLLPFCFIFMHSSFFRNVIFKKFFSPTMFSLIRSNNYWSINISFTWREPIRHYIFNDFSLIWSLYLQLYTTKIGFCHDIDNFLNSDKLWML